MHPNKGPLNDPEYGDLWDGDIEGGAPEAGEPDLLNAMWNLNRRWPDNVLHYHIREEYSEEQVELIEAGVKDLMDSIRVDGATCIDFRHRTTETAYVDVQKYSGCSSSIGRTGSAQRMSLVDSCVTRHGTIMHEFLHALGFHHEHKRADRDDYVTINEDNIQPDKMHNFDKLVEGETVDHMGTVYDYGSVMHYSAYGFAIDPSIPTIIPHDPNAEIGQRLRLSDLDIERVQIFYCCLDPEDSKYHQHLADVMRDYC
jgi:astacin